jgi:hypothetical protein
MSQFNVWLGMSPEFRAAITPDEEGETAPGSFGVLSTLAPETKDLLLTTHDVPAQERLFVANGTYRLYSHYGEAAGEAIVKADVDLLIATYPSDLTVLGSWDNATGMELGATYDEFGVQTAPGWYPVPATVLNYMPDILTDPGTPEGPGGIPPAVPPIFAPPIVPTDVNLLFGQVPRDFTSFYP